MKNRTLKSNSFMLLLAWGIQMSSAEGLIGQPIKATIKGKPAIQVGKQSGTNLTVLVVRFKAKVDVVAPTTHAEMGLRSDLEYAGVSARPEGPNTPLVEPLIVWNDDGLPPCLVVASGRRETHIYRKEELPIEAFTAAASAGDVYLTLRYINICKRADGKTNVTRFAFDPILIPKKKTK